MSVDRTFISAYIDNGTVHRVLGVKLRPFCAWHLFQFQIIDSPFLRAGDVYLYHLRRAVGICRLRYPSSRIRPPFFPLILKPKRFRVEVAKFMIYLGDYINKPEYGIIPFDEFSRGSKPVHLPTPPPETVQLAFDVASGANVPIQDAWNMPLGQAYVAQAMHYREKGLRVDFMNEGEREFQEHLKEYLEKQGNGAR